MQFGEHTVQQWSLLLDASPAVTTSANDNNNNNLITLTSATTPPHTSSSPSTSTPTTPPPPQPPPSPQQQRPQQQQRQTNQPQLEPRPQTQPQLQLTVQPLPIPSTSLSPPLPQRPSSTSRSPSPPSPPPSPPPTPPSPPSPPSCPPSPVTSPSPPQPLTWAARVAAVRQPSARALPPPRHPSLLRDAHITTTAATPASPTTPPAPTVEGHEQKSKQQKPSASPATATDPISAEVAIPVTASLPRPPAPPPHPSPPRRRRPPPASLPPPIQPPPPQVPTALSTSSTSPPATDLPPVVPHPSSSSSASKPLNPSSPQSPPTPLPPRRLRGLINSGNTCFINVVLQALLACLPFRQLLHSCRTLPQPHSLLAKFIRLAHEMAPAKDPSRSVQDPSVHSSAADNVDHGGSNDHPTRQQKNVPRGNNKPSKSAAPATSNVHQNGNNSNNNDKNTKGNSKNIAIPPLTDDPLLPDSFFDVFPPPSSSTATSASTPSNHHNVRLSPVSNGSQEDAEEFLSFVLNALHEELVAAQPPLSPTSQTMPASKSQANGYHPSIAQQPSLQNLNSSTSTSTSSVSLGHRITHDDEDGWVEMTRNGKSVEIRGREFARSGITDIFGGALRSEVKRPRSKPSVTREPFFSLSLDIESGMIRDLDHALAAYFEPEFLEGLPIESVNGAPGPVEGVRKHVLLQQMPEVLILHLKRFSHNAVTGALNKVSRMLAFPEVLHVPGRLMHSPASRWGAESSKTYELTAVVTHIGKELAGGHYTCDVRWQGEDDQYAWVTCDDSKVVRTFLPKVTRKQAYLLFYSATKGA